MASVAELENATALHDVPCPAREALTMINERFPVLFLALKVQVGSYNVVWWSELLATDPEVRVRFPALPDFLVSSGSGTRSTQPREYN
jgi:hypothetical protein